MYLWAKAFEQCAIRPTLDHPTTLVFLVVHALFSNFFMALVLGWICWKGDASPLGQPFFGFAQPKWIGTHYRTHPWGKYLLQQWEAVSGDIHSLGKKLCPHGYNTHSSGVPRVRSLDTKVRSGYVVLSIKVDSVITVALGYLRVWFCA